MQDRIISGVAIGLLADGVKLIFNYLAYRFGFASVLFWQIVASRFLEKQDLYKPIAFFIGGIADLTATSIIGVTFLLLIEISGKDYSYIKGAGFALAVWAGVFGSLLGQSGRAKLPLNSSDITVTIFAHLIFGLALAYFTNRRFRMLKKIHS